MCVWSVMMSLPIALFIVMTSQTALRPRRSGVFTSTWVTTPMQALREKALRLLAFLRGERVDHAVHGLDRARGVQRAEHQVPGLGGRHRPADGVRVAQLAHQDDVRVLAHRCPNAFGERGQVGMQLALDHLRELAAVDELDRVFEADDVELSVPVQVIDHRCERGRLARPGRAGHQHQPLVVVAEAA